MEESPEFPSLLSCLLASFPVVRIPKASKATVKSTVVRTQGNEIKIIIPFCIYFFSGEML
jgi:hypothetical protein